METDRVFGGYGICALFFSFSDNSLLMIKDLIEWCLDLIFNRFNRIRLELTGPLAEPDRRRPSLKMTARSYSCTT